MSNIATPIEKLIERAEDYGKTTIELMKLNATGKSADVISSLAVQLVVLLGVALCVFAATIALGLWLGELMGKNYYGFFAVAGIYAVITLVVYAFRKQWVKTPVSNSIIVQMRKNGSK